MKNFFIKIFLACFLLAGFSSTAFAERRTFESFNKKFSLDFPQSWHAEQSDFGCVATDRNGDNRLSVKVLPRMHRDIKEVLYELTHSIGLEIVEEREMADGLVLLCKKEKSLFFLLGCVLDHTNMIALINGKDPEPAFDIASTFQNEN